MSTQELVNRICSHLRRNDIHLSNNNIWLQSCIDWFKNHNELANTYSSLEHYVLIQWCLADLQDVQNSCLPLIVSEGKVELNGSFNVQINWARDIAQSCYTQLQGIQNINESESNDFVSADEPKKQSWEPSPKRVLMMEITDGVNTVKAMEYSPIPKLVEPFLPGLKVLLKGPIECRNGILFLKNSNIIVLGGEVDSLSVINSKANILSKCLNIPENTTNMQQTVNNNVTTEASRPNNVPARNCNLTLRNNQNDTMRTAPEHNQPQRWSPIMEFEEPNPPEEAPRERSISMQDDDDEWFLQVPDAILDQSLNQEVDNPPTVSNSSRNDHWEPEEDQEEDIFQRSNYVSKAQPPNKAKLFPFVYNRKKENHPSSSTASNNPVFKQDRDSSFTTTSSAYPKSGPSQGSDCKSPNMSPTFNEHLRPRQSPLRNPVLNKEKSLDDQATEINNEYLLPKEELLVKEEKYPQYKELHVKIDGKITNLKIKNKIWTCSAQALIDGRPGDVNFSDQVLEKLFGISASEVERNREEMKNNAELKKKLNNDLKNGQTKVKTLNCLMTLEYTSKDCVPLVIDIKLVPC